MMIILWLVPASPWGHAGDKISHLTIPVDGNGP